MHRFIDVYIIWLHVGTSDTCRYAKIFTLDDVRYQRDPFAMPSIPGSISMGRIIPVLLLLSYKAS